jgi:hypothetical protein
MNMQRSSAPILASLALAVLALPAQAQLGVAAGLNYNRLDDIEGSVDATFDNSTGFHFGAFVNLGSGTLAVRPGVFYHRIGTYDLPGEDELTLSAVEVPLDVRLTIAPSGILDAYVLAAPVVTFPRCKEFDEAVEDWQLTADIGVGLDLAVPGLGINLMPELRYSFGVTEYLSDEFEVGSITVMPDDSERRVSKLMLRLNVML